MKLSKHRGGNVLLLVLVLAASALAALAGCQGDFGGGGSSSDDFLDSGRTTSFFQAIQVDPRNEASAGPQFVTSADIDGDGNIDLVSAWNQSQPVQIHFQRGSGNNRSFETVTLAGNIPVVRVSGLSVADFNMDGNPDIAVMIKETGLNRMGVTCFGGQTGTGYHGIILLYLAPANTAQSNQSLAWQEVPVESSRVLGLPIDAFAGTPEEEGYTSMAVADLDEDGDPDIVAALNDACTAIDPKVLLFRNLGPGAVQDGTWQAEAIPDPFEKGPRLVDDPGIFPPARIKDVALGDVDNDGDIDIIATYPEAVSMNIRWYRNPTIDIPDDYHFTSTQWRTGVVGMIAPNIVPFPGPLEDLGGADVIRVGDIDDDGQLDVVVRSSGGRVIQWLKGPGFRATTDPVRAIPWQVYTIAEYSERTPEGLGLGDVNKDGQLEVIASAAGGLAFFDGSAADSVYDKWPEELIIDDARITSGEGEGEAEGITFINSIHVVDLDGDGANDIVATFDRSGLSGLTNDALVWFQNTSR